METSQLVARLRAAGVETVVIGGIAMRLHGSTRVTQDLDLAIRGLDSDRSAADDADLAYLRSL